MLQETGSSTRREFARNALQSLTALALIEGLWSSRLFGAGVRPLIDDWFKELNAISKDVHDHKTKDIEFQKALEELYRRVDLQALLESLDFDRLAAGVNFPAKGAKSFSGDELHMTGLPKKPLFGRQIFAMKKGRSVVPHGHDNMATGFLVLEGQFPRPALRPGRGPFGPLPHSPDDRSRVQARRVLDDLRPQRQHSLVHRRERNRLHFQRPRGRDQSRKQEAAGASLHRPPGRKTCRRPDQGPQDLLRQGQSALRLKRPGDLASRLEPRTAAVGFRSPPQPVRAASRPRREPRGYGG